MSTASFRKSLLFRYIAFTVLTTFIGLLPAQPSYAQVAIIMPPPGQMIHITNHFEPPQMVGLKIDLKDPFNFDFIMDQGENPMPDDAKKEEFNKIIKYFLVSLAMPNDDMWVNLSPYESKRIIPAVFAQTEMGRDLLAQDYILKQFTASLIYPEDGLGKKFWDSVYAQAQARFGTTEINVNTFNKVWIVADHADVYQKDDTAFLIGSHLKVMLEQDYMAISKNKEQFGDVQSGTMNQAEDARTKMASDLVRQIIIPAIEKEVNEGKSFAAVRQVYNTEIMATWFKKTLRESLLGQVFANKSKIAGQKVDDPRAMEKIYREYLRAYKTGVFNYIREDASPDGQAIPRKYFSGGLKSLAMNTEQTYTPRTLTQRAAAEVRRLSQRFTASSTNKVKRFTLAKVTLGLLSLAVPASSAHAGTRAAQAELPAAQTINTPATNNVPETKAISRVINHQNNALGGMINDVTGFLNNFTKHALNTTGLSLKTRPENNPVLSVEPTNLTNKLSAILLEIQQSATNNTAENSALQDQVTALQEEMQDYKNQLQAAKTNFSDQSERDKKETTDALVEIAGAKQSIAVLTQFVLSLQEASLKGSQVNPELQANLTALENLGKKVDAINAQFQNFQTQSNHVHGDYIGTLDRHLSIIEAFAVLGIGGLLLLKARKDKAAQDASERMNDRVNGLVRQLMEAQKANQQLFQDGLKLQHHVDQLKGAMKDLQAAHDEIRGKLHRLVQNVLPLQLNRPAHISENVSAEIRNLNQQLQRVGEIKEAWSADQQNNPGYQTDQKDRNLAKVFLGLNHLGSREFTDASIDEEVRLVRKQRIMAEVQGPVYDHQKMLDEAVGNKENELNAQINLLQEYRGRLDWVSHLIHEVSSRQQTEDRTVEQIEGHDIFNIGVSQFALGGTVQSTKATHAGAARLIKKFSDGAITEDHASELLQEVIDEYMHTPAFNIPLGYKGQKLADVIVPKIREVFAASKETRDLEEKLAHALLEREHMEREHPAIKAIVNKAALAVMPHSVALRNPDQVSRVAARVVLVTPRDLGGINLSDENLTMNIKVDGAGMPLAAQYQDKAMLDLNGLTSIIRSITPVTPANVPAVYELLK